MHTALLPSPHLGGQTITWFTLLASYQPNVLQQPPITRTIRVWSEQSMESLQDCLDLTDCDVFYRRAHGRDIDDLAEAFTGYLNFCTDLSIPTKTTRCFSNNKPWITRDIRHLPNRK
ncbi:hypothetical protein DPEC_G00195960 [Dallia pectoralis]|uniref:Uncharacterized protein n=1 Tax=Dallia pectoralis TaxID=75939 RepID=A0ACC2G7P5_DALPE|nr:hypothetical protein DPEC_G00195960 [Dallia pectoralis]